MNVQTPSAFSLHLFPLHFSGFSRASPALAGPAILFSQAGLEVSAGLHTMEDDGEADSAGIIVQCGAQKYWQLVDGHVGVMAPSGRNATWHP